MTEPVSLDELFDPHRPAADGPACEICTLSTTDSDRVMLGVEAVEGAPQGPVHEVCLIAADLDALRLAVVAHLTAVTQMPGLEDAPIHRLVKELGAITSPAASPQSGNPA